MSTTFNPYILTVKIFTAGPVKTTPHQINELFASLGTVVEFSATQMVFNGTALVPATEVPTAQQAAPTPAPAAPTATKEKARKVQASQTISRKKAAVKAEAEAKEPKTISFTPGSDPERIWQFIRTNVAMTSTQIREKLGLGSNIVNTTVYRLKNAGMIRPMSHTAPNGDTLYTSTEWDGPKESPMQIEEAIASLTEGLEREASDTDIL